MQCPETLTQTIAKNLKVPILTGAPPLRYPGDKPEDSFDDDDNVMLWEKGARTFVQYYAMLLPFDYNVDPRDSTLPHLAVQPWNKIYPGISLPRYLNIGMLLLTEQKTNGLDTSVPHVDCFITFFISSSKQNSPVHC